MIIHKKSFESKPLDQLQSLVSTQIRVKIQLSITQFKMYEKQILKLIIFGTINNILQV
jgi:hypothetical protein